MACHPLLQLSLARHGKKVVPLDIELDSRRRILVISGPNAGGKSVCLKTVGLIQYMLQCGLPVPVGENSRTGIFGSIFIDIGDEQSIEDDLSTYSSHLLNMKNMMKSCGGNSLLLIDEFGGGTEPQIGGAIAEAVLKRFNQKKAFGIITTHYQNLKHFAEDHEGVVNGAMLYDRQHMQALFQLQIGNPGSSFAVEIARKIGLPEDVIADASDIVGKEYINADKYLQDIVRDKRYWETKRQTIHQREKEMEKTIARCLPFSDTNKRLVISKVSTIVRSNAIGIPLLAIIQGGVAAIGYSLCGVNRPIEFGALTGFASMIPIVGSMLVWIPLAILQYFEHGLMPAIYLVAYGALIISQCDNVLRMVVQKRLANTHPLITIFGVIAGLPLFGFMGLIFGPLLVAMFLLFLEMFVNQYIIGDSEHGIVSSPKRKHRPDSNNPGGTSLTERFKRRVIPSAPSKDERAKAESAPNATPTAEQPTQSAASPAQTVTPNAKRPNPHLEQPKAKNFKSAKAQSKQEKREGAKLRAAQNAAPADLKTTPSKATPAVKSEPKAAAKAQSAKPETKNAQSAPKSNQSAAKSAAQPETKSAPAAQPEAKSAVVPAQDGGALRTLSPKAPAPQQPDIPPFKHLGQSATVRALRAQERFDLGSRDPDAAKRHNLVARAVAQAIGSFDQLDDLEGSLEAPVLPPEKLKSAQTPPEAAPERKEVAPRERGANDQRTSADKRPANDKRQAPAQRERAATTPRERPATKGDRPARRERKHERPANSDSAPGRKERSRLVSKLKPQGAKPVRGKTRRSNLDYQVLRPERPHREPAPIVHTVVSRSAGFEPQEPKHTLRTQLVSVHTAKGTMLANPPRRRPSRRRPFH